jgi:hypothetical protein
MMEFQKELRHMSFSAELRTVEAPFIRLNKTVKYAHQK